MILQFWLCLFLLSGIGRYTPDLGLTKVRFLKRPTGGASASTTSSSAASSDMVVQQITPFVFPAISSPDEWVEVFSSDPDEAVFLLPVLSWLENRANKVLETKQTLTYTKITFLSFLV